MSVIKSGARLSPPMFAAAAVVLGAMVLLVLASVPMTRADATTTTVPTTTIIISGTTTPSTLDEFRFVSVSLSVKDINGIPVGGAEVLAFSEDWGIRSPGTRDQQTFWSTDSSGNVSMTIPIGTWSFFAFSGSNYVNSHGGRGLFVCSVDETINDNVSITLQPSATITIYPKDVSGNPIDVQASVMETHHTPIIPTDFAAVSNGGRLLIDVSGRYSYDLLLVKRPDSSSDGYYMTLRDIAGGFDNQIYFQPSQLSRITFQAYDENNNSTEGNVEVRLPGFDLNNRVIDFGLDGSATVYFTPSVVQFDYRFIESGWYFYLLGNNFFNLTAGSSQTISFGGPFSEELQVIPWASTGAGGSPAFSPRTQVWLKITDNFGHILNTLGTPSGKPQFPFTLTQNGSTIFTSSIPQGDPFTLYINAEYQKDSSPYFTVSGDLGPFGTFHLNGTLISDATMYKIDNITTQHFLAAVPEGFPDQTTRTLSFMDKLYETYENMMGAPIDGQVQYEVDIMGGGFWWENLPAPTKLLLIMYITSDPLSPNTLFCNAHEFGHTRTLRSPTCIALDYFGESIPTLLAIEGISRIYGPNMWLWETGQHDLFFYHLRGTPLVDGYDLIETSQFVLAYIEKTYGWNAHKMVISGWSGNLSNLVQKLTQNGFNQVEILATLYSYVVDNNLGWLFEMAGLGVTEARVNQGLNLTTTTSPTTPTTTTTQTLTTTTTTTSTTTATTPLPSQQPHNPISINGNSQFTSANGVVSGSGTVDNPYIIQGWAIDASTANGIDIQNTTAYFIVRNCLVENGENSYCGIYLDNVINGKLENNNCLNNDNSIYLDSSSYNTLTNNTCENNVYEDNFYTGIYLDSSSYNTLINNTCENNGAGIFIYSSNNNTLTNNTCGNNGFGIVLSRSSNNTLTGNTCDNNSLYGIFLSGSSYNNLTSNTCENNYYGDGIYLWGSSNNTLTGNTCENNHGGIYLNTFSGISSTNYSENNTIFYNYLLNNMTGNAYDNGGTNSWDYNGRGNYWSDWQPPEHPSSNGIVVDTPRPIAGGANQDNYPLVFPAVITTTTTTTTPTTTTSTTTTPTQTTTTSLTTTASPSGTTTTTTTATPETTWIWVGVGIAIVVVIAIVAWALMRRK
jgi:parallel beta-helix repeat protein